MRVLHLVKTSSAAIWAYQQMRELVKANIEVHVAMPCDGSLVPQYKEAGIHVHDITFTLSRLTRSIGMLRKLVKEIQPDLIHSHFVITTLAMRLGLRNSNIPRVFQVPGPLHLEHFFYRNTEIALAQKNDYWIGSCKWINEIYRRHGISNDKIFLSYYGTDLPDVAIPERSSRNRRLRDEFKLKDNDIVIGMVAYMYAPKYHLGQTRGLKGHEDFIDIIAQLRKNNTNVFGICIGGPFKKAIRYEKAIHDYADKKCPEGIFFTGTRSNVPELYGDIDLVIHPTHTESAGGTQSLIYDVPVIASNTGGIPDIVQHRKTGLLVPPKDIKAFVRETEWALENMDKMNQMAQAGQKHILEILDCTKSAKIVNNIYHKICN